MGKSLFVQRMAEQLSAVKNVAINQCQVTIPLHGPVITSDKLLNFLKNHYEDNKCMMYHLDIAPNVSITIILTMNMVMFPSFNFSWNLSP